MSIFGFLIKLYIVVLIFRGVMTRQELYFNPLGKFIAALTEPFFGTILRNYPHERSKKFIPLLIVIIGVIYALIIWTFTQNQLLLSLIISFDDLIRFLMIFYVVSLILGSLLNTSYQTSVYTTFFYRIGLPWVNAARKVIKISGNGIVVPAIVLVFLVYLLLDSGVQFLYGLYLYGSFDVLNYVTVSLRYGLFGLVDLLGILTWLIIIRALISWVNPDPYNPIVQILVALTEPVMGPFRRIIPPLGMIDISPIILLFVIEFLRMFLKKLIGMIF